jgi:glycosyltransferase involved in cell wall biosynthesis
MKRMRVLHVGKYYPPHRGGMETHLQELCTELCKEIDVRVVVANAEPRDITEVVDGVPVSRVATVASLAGSPICPGMARRIRESEADLIHIQLPNPTAILAYWASGHKGRLVLTYQSDVIRQKYLGKVFYPILYQTMQRAAAVIATSPNYVASSPVLSKWAERCRIIPLGTDLRRFDRYDQPAVDAIRSRFGPRMVLSVGRLVSYKGFDYLVRAMQAVQGHLVIVGNGPLRDQLLGTARALGVSGRVTILSGIDDVVPYYRAASLFVLPSIARTEAFGLVQLEAMACAKPVVNTQLDSGVPFVSRHGITGLTVPPKDVSALASAVCILLDNQQLSYDYGIAARKRVEQLFNVKKMVQSTLRLYSQLMTLREQDGAESIVAMGAGS